MKINGFQVNEHGSGYEVTVRIHIGSEEAGAEWLSGVFHNAMNLVNDNENEPGAAPAEEPAKTTRRRPVKKADAKPKVPDMDLGIVGRRPTKKSSATDADGSTKPTRRRASPKKADAAKSPSKITDQDLSKAVTLAAKVLSSEPIMDMLTEYGVENVRDLKEDVREEFLAQLQAAVAGKVAS